jgi:FixJ family two-component response regulator
VQARDRVIGAGASAFLRKPVDDQALLDAVGKAIPDAGATDWSEGEDESPVTPIPR